MEAEIIVLRQQIIVLRRGRPSRMPFLTVDRMVLGWVCQLFPTTREALAIAPIWKSKQEPSLKSMVVAQLSSGAICLDNCFFAS